MSGAVTLLDAALALAARELSVIPIHSPSMPLPPRVEANSAGKRPLVAWREFQQRRATEDEIRQWWSEWPAANIGIVTGAISNVVVVDVDGPEGQQTLRTVNPIPVTWRSTTGRGEHLWFRHPGFEVQNFAKKAPGLDFRGDRGYVVAPGSRHRSGVEYRWTIPPEEAELADPPRWLFELLAKPITKDAEQSEAKWWLRLLQGAKEGERHDALLRIAGHYLGIGREPDEVEALLLEFARRCTPPHDPKDVIQVVRDLAGKKRVTAVLPAAAPDMRREGDNFSFALPDQGIEVYFSHLREGPDGLHGEITVRSSIRGEIHWGRFNLSSTPSREGLVKKLNDTHPSAPWRSLLDRACHAVAEQVRQGEPIMPLEPAAAPTTRQLVERLLPLGETSVIFGDGGTGKSLLALAVAVAVSSKAPLPGGLRPMQDVSVLYLDWESCREEQAERLEGLLAGLGLSATSEIHYRPMARALADDAAHLRTEVDRLGVGLVIVDSLGPACGAEPESADAAIRTLNALRSFAPATRLVIAHVSKADIARNGPSRPYGSVYVQNLARSVWEIRRSDDESKDLVLGLFHRKCNTGRLSAPIGLRFEFGEDGIRLLPSDIGEQPDLLAKTSLTFQIQKTLTAGGRTVDEIAKTLDANPDTVRRTLNRLKEARKVVSLDNGRGGRWGLKT